MKKLIMLIGLLTIGCNDENITRVIKGDKGDVGATGVQGPTGPQGPAGADATLPSGVIVESFQPCNLKAAGLQLIHRLSNGQLMTTSALAYGPQWTAILYPGDYKTADGECSFTVEPDLTVTY